jgi:hypothetical protein
MRFRWASSVYRVSVFHTYIVLGIGVSFLDGATNGVHFAWEKRKVLILRPPIFLSLFVFNL